MALSGKGVALATVGGLFVYAGLTKQGLTGAFRALASGHPPGISTSSSSAANNAAALTALGAGAAAGVQALLPSGGSTIGPELVAAAQSFQSDLYSQTKRWQVGYSDCSSFVGKSFAKIGITPPGASTTLSYLAWSKLTKIPAADVGAGDLLCNSTHVVIAINSTTAIGQENPSINVQVGSFSDLMAGTGTYVVLRYNGAAAASAAAPAGYQEV
jgi:cell wall-associated NlpC family hydrolase